MGLNMRLKRSIPLSLPGTGGKSYTGFDFDLGVFCRETGSSALFLRVRMKEEKWSEGWRGKGAVNFDLGRFPKWPN